MHLTMQYFHLFEFFGAMRHRVSPGAPIINNGTHGPEKLLLKTQVREVVK